jgi:hypothetical protein
LLDYAAPQIGVHTSAFRTFNGVAQAFIFDPFPPRIARKPLCLENPHATP